MELTAKAVQDVEDKRHSWTESGATVPILLYLMLTSGPSVPPPNQITPSPSAAAALSSAPVGLRGVKPDSAAWGGAAECPL